MAFDYKTWYVNRRNKLCLDHNSVSPKGRCEECLNIRRKRPSVFISELDSDEVLDNAAYLEYQVAMQTIDIRTARHRLVEQFPETNIIPTTYNRYDRSVINLIRPYYTTVFTLENRKENSDE